jgi:hypothetical protein
MPVNPGYQRDSSLCDFVHQVVRCGAFLRNSGSVSDGREVAPDVGKKVGVWRKALNQKILRDDPVGQAHSLSDFRLARCSQFRWNRNSSLTEEACHAGTDP